MRTLLLILAIAALVWLVLAAVNLIRPHAAWSAGGNVVCQMCGKPIEHPHAQQWTERPDQDEGQLDP